MKLTVVAGYVCIEARAVRVPVRLFVGRRMVTGSVWVEPDGSWCSALVTHVLAGLPAAQAEDALRLIRTVAMLAIARHHRADPTPASGFFEAPELPVGES